MNHHQFRRFLILAGLAGFACAGVAEAVGNDWFPIFGIVNGAQTARINAVLTQPPEPELPCPVTLVFFDSQGNQLGGPDTFELRGGVAVHKDLVGPDPSTRIGTRLEIRAQVTIGDPGLFPGCAVGVLTSVEVVNRLTHDTHFILTNPVKAETAPRL